jgi:hypothetical protein
VSAGAPRGFREFNARKPNILLAFGPEINLKGCLAGALPIVMIAVDYDPAATCRALRANRFGGRGVNGMPDSIVCMSLSRAKQVG